MKKILPVFAIVLSFEATAQLFQSVNYSVNRPYLENENEIWLKEIAHGKQIRSVTKTGKNRKDNQSYTLNADGYVTEAMFGYKSGSFIFNSWTTEHKKFHYQNNFVDRIDHYNKHGENVLSFTYEYFIPGKVKAYKTFRKGKLVSENRSGFNADSTVSEYLSVKYKNGKQQQISCYKHTYYPNKQRKRTELYGRNNKLKHVWNYECEPKGELTERKTTRVCRNTGTDNKGRQIEVFFNTEANGKKSKQVITSYIVNNRKHVVLTEFYAIEKKGEKKIFETHNPDSIEKYYSYVVYANDGKPAWESRIEYNEYTCKSQIPLSKSNTTFKKSVIRSQTKETYSENGLPIGSVTTSGKKVISKTDYTYHGDTGFTVKKINAKGKLIHEYQTKIEYF